uniref:Phospholipase DDHD1-like n=1 Tax=Hirondellea gigas TaxID=1518452 RepID=A0A6A7G0P5_9CRUS
MQYKGILSSQSCADGSGLLYGTDWPMSAMSQNSLASAPRLHLEPDLQLPPHLSLTLNETSPSASFLSYRHTDIDSSPYISSNLYEYSSLDHALDVPFSPMPYSSSHLSHSPSPTPLLTVNKSTSRSISPSKLLTKTASQQLSKKAASAASYILGSNSTSVTSQKQHIQQASTDILQTTTPQPSSYSSVSPIPQSQQQNVSDDLYAQSILPNQKDGNHEKIYSSYINYDTRTEMVSNTLNSSQPTESKYSDTYFNAGTASTDKISNGSAPASIDPYLTVTPTVTTRLNSSSSEHLLDPGGPNNLGSFNSQCLYFKEFVEDLGPEEYRWFYKTDSDKKWIPFIGYDSLRIEWKFRDLQHNGIAGVPLSTAYGLEASNENGGTGASGCDAEVRPFELGEEGTVTVRGGLYEVHVKQRRGQSIYWRGEVFVVCRGIWFYEGAWTPLDSVLEEKIETEHLVHFRGHPLNVPRSSDAQKQVVHRMSVSEGSVEWFSASEVYLALDATPARLMRSVGKKLGFQRTGYKIHRGYSLDANASDKPPDITHLVFVIHGIGQKMDTGRIIKNSTSLRDNVNTLKQRYLKELPPGSLLDPCNDSATNTTVEFFPVEWRSLLTLDNGLIDCITPLKILNIRQMLNASFMDIMYYNSPQYREEIVTVLSSELNRLYALFTERNPYFEANGGKVSAISHSLGCVITYDIVTGWSPMPQLSTSFLQAMSDVLSTQQHSSSKVQLQVALQQLLHNQHVLAEQPNLNFKIENLFCFGSPLAVFLALRWRKTAGAPPMLSNGRFQRLLNIFHPSDPVAYRVEPLISSLYCNIEPVQVHCHSASDKLPYNQMPLEPVLAGKEPGQDGGNAESANTPTTSLPSSPVRGTSSWNLWGLMKGGKKSTDSAAQQLSQSDPQHSSPSAGWVNSLGSTSASGVAGGSSATGTGVGDSLNCDQLSESKRIDFVLREGSMESSYISALTSHTNYWSNFDVAHFLLTILYPHLNICSGTAAATVTTSSLSGSSSNSTVSYSTSNKIASFSNSSSGGSLLNSSPSYTIPSKSTVSSSLPYSTSGSKINTSSYISAATTTTSTTTGTTASISDNHLSTGNTRPINRLSPNISTASAAVSPGRTSPRYNLSSSLDAVSTKYCISPSTTRDYSMLSTIAGGATGAASVQEGVDGGGPRSYSSSSMYADHKVSYKACR